MTVAYPPLIEPNGRISRIRLSGFVHRFALPFLPACADGWAFPSPQLSQLTLASLPDVLSTLTPPEFRSEADGCLLWARRPSPFR
jgi:hypothetical protein